MRGERRLEMDGGAAAVGAAGDGDAPAEGGRAGVEVGEPLPGRRGRGIEAHAVVNEPHGERVIRGPNGEIEVTFGRTEGPAFRHIQLLARTVSRRHALMRLSDDHWSLVNLSATNPVVLNGRPLAADEVAPLLVDGDRIEMGEVIFTFHSR